MDQLGDGEQKAGGGDAAWVGGWEEGVAFAAESALEWVSPGRVRRGEADHWSPHSFWTVRRSVGRRLWWQSSRSPPDSCSGSRSGRPTCAEG